MKYLNVKWSLFFGAMILAHCASAAHPVLGDTAIESGWHQSPWFGWFADDIHSWIIHAEHGSLYPIAGESGIFWYDLNLRDWIWTSADLYPNIYKYRINQGWYLYNRGGIPSERWFFSFGALKWLHEGDLLTESKPRGWHLIEYAFSDASYTNKESFLAGTTSILVDNLSFEGGHGDIQITHTRHDKASGNSVASRTYRVIWSDPPAYFSEGSRPSLHLELDLIGYSGGWSAIPQNSVYWNQGFGAYFVLQNGTKFFSADISVRLELEKEVTAGATGSTRTVQVNLGESFVATYLYAWHD